jgi:Domain of unknown function (DUF4365)
LIEGTMTPQQQKEELSKAYVAAVAARCGFKLGLWSQDDDGLDVTIGAAGLPAGGLLAGPKLDLQLKASSDPRHDRGDSVAYSLSRRMFELLTMEACVPRILVVLMLPEPDREWVQHTPESLILRKCAYWASLRSLPSMAEGVGSTTVLLSKSNVFSPETLTRLMAKVSRDEAL